MPETIDEKCLMLMKDAFKRYLLERLGPIEDKPHMELGAWTLALIEVAHEVRSQQSLLEDDEIKNRTSPNV